MPAEAFQYEIAYEAFRADTEFWENWKVVDCARGGPDTSLSRDSASIRVVMDLPSSQRLFPTAYTPGFPTLPFGVAGGLDLVPGRLSWVAEDALPESMGEDLHTGDAMLYQLEDIKEWCQDHGECVGFAYEPNTKEWKPKQRDTGFDVRSAQWHTRQAGWQFFYIEQRAEGRRNERHIAGLPPGYSVALDVHILEESRIMLVHQKSFRNGHIDPKYEWLDAIVRKAAGNEAVKTNPRAKQKSSRVKALQTQENRPEAELRPPVGTLPMDCSEPGLSEGLKAFSDTYGDTARMRKHVGLGRNQVHEENTLVSAFGSDLRLPPREEGTWGGESAPSEEKEERLHKELEALEGALDDIIERTTERGARRDGSLLQGRLDR